MPQSHAAWLASLSPERRARIEEKTASLLAEVAEHERTPRAGAVRKQVAASMLTVKGTLPKAKGAHARRLPRIVA